LFSRIICISHACHYTATQDVRDYVDHNGVNDVDDDEDDKGENIVTKKVNSRSSLCHRLTTSQTAIPIDSSPTLCNHNVKKGISQRQSVCSTVEDTPSDGDELPITSGRAGDWEKKFVMLKQYKMRHGDFNVPYKGSQRCFAKWVGSLRSKKDKGLTEDQKEKLNSIGFDWLSQKEKEDQAWMTRYHSLVEYKKINGHTLVPQRDNALAIWVANQRKRAKQEKMREDRKRLLDDIGFQWEVHRIKKRSKSVETVYDVRWNTMFQKLEEYKNSQGNCNVPYNYDKDHSLGMWVSSQRKIYKKKTWTGSASGMNTARRKKLEKIGFNFFITGQTCKI